MQNVVTQLLNELADLLGPLSPFSKAVVPAALSVAVALINSAFAGKVDAVSVAIAASGLVLALVTYLVPNKAKKAPAVPPGPPAVK